MVLEEKIFKVVHVGKKTLRSVSGAVTHTPVDQSFQWNIGLEDS